MNPLTEIERLPGHLQSDVRETFGQMGDVSVRAAFLGALQQVAHNLRGKARRKALEARADSRWVQLEEEARAHIADAETLEALAAELEVAA